MKKEEAIQTLNVMQSSYSHIRHSDAEWEALEMAKEYLQTGVCTESGGTVKTGPLTLEELRKMGGHPVWVQKEDNGLESCWGIVCLAYGQEYVMSFIQVYQGYGMLKVHFSEYGKTWLAYSYPPVCIDWERWTAEWKEYSGADAGFHYCSRCDQQAFNYEDGGEVVEVLSDFCPSCGRATTKNGIDILKKRMEEIR